MRVTLSQLSDCQLSVLNKMLGQPRCSAEDGVGLIATLLEAIKECRTSVGRESRIHQLVVRVT